MNDGGDCRTAPVNTVAVKYTLYLARPLSPLYKVRKTYSYYLDICPPYKVKGKYPQSSVSINEQYPPQNPILSAMAIWRPVLSPHFSVNEQYQEGLSAIEDCELKYII